MKPAASMNCCCRNSASFIFRCNRITRLNIRFKLRGSMAGPVPTTWVCPNVPKHQILCISRSAYASCRQVGRCHKGCPSRALWDPAKWYYHGSKSTQQDIA